MSQIPRGKASTDFILQTNHDIVYVWFAKRNIQKLFWDGILVSCQDNYKTNLFVQGKNWFINKPLKSFHFESCTCLFDLYLPRQDKVLGNFFVQFYAITYI